MQKINVEMLSTLDKGVKKGSLVVWNSENGTLNTSVNLYDIFDNIAHRENEIFRSNAILSQALFEVSKAKSLNISNTEKYNQLKQRIDNLSAKLSLNELEITTSVKEFDTLISTELLRKEWEANNVFINLNDYISSIESLKIQSYAIISNITVVENQIQVFEDRNTKNKEKLENIEMLIKKLDIDVLNLNMKVLTLSMKVKPTVEELINLKKLAIDIQKRLKYLLSEIDKLELTVEEIPPIICDIESIISRLEILKDEIKGKVDKLKSEIELYSDKVVQLTCDINLLYDKTINLNDLSNKISDYLEKSKNFIEDGLLVAGDNIEIEYKNGFAIIHSRIAEYGSRPVPARDCFDSSKIELTFPAPPCPPSVPGCPSCSETPSTTSAPATTTNAATTTTKSATTTTTAGPKGCYYAYRNYFQNGNTSGTIMNNVEDGELCIGQVLGGYGVDCSYSTGVGFYVSTLSAAQAWVENNTKYGGNYPVAQYYIVRIDEPGCTASDSGDKLVGGDSQLKKSGKAYTCIESGVVDQITSGGAIRTPDSFTYCA